jgi:hypothetical protein
MALSIVENLSDDGIFQKRRNHTNTNTNSQTFIFLFCLIICSSELHYQKLIKAGIIPILVEIVSLEVAQGKDQDTIQTRRQRALTSIKHFLENDGPFLYFSFFLSFLSLSLC